MEQYTNMSMAEFEVTYAPTSFDMATLACCPQKSGSPDVHSAIMLNNPQLAAVMREFKHVRSDNDSFGLRGISSHIGYTAGNTYSKEAAIKQIRNVEKIISEMQQTISELRILESYYVDLSAAIEQTETNTAYILYRHVNIWTDKKVTYKLFKGIYNITLKHLEYGELLESFPGREHRIAVKKLESLVNDDKGSYGFVTNYQTQNGIKPEDAQYHF